MLFQIKSNYKVINKEFNEEKKCCEISCIEFRNGNSVCLNCGMVFEKELVDQEKRAYNKEEREKKIHTELRWREFGPRTIIQIRGSDFNGQSLKAGQRVLFSRLSKIQNSLISSIERNFWEAKPKMKQLVSKLNIPTYISGTAWKIYIVVAKKKLTMGRSIEGFIAASLYVSIRIHQFLCLLEDICDAFITPRRTVVHSIGIIIKEVLPELKLAYKPITPEQLIHKFGNELGISMEVLNEALYIYDDSIKKGIPQIGKDPKGLAASAIYLALKKNKIKETQSKIAKMAKITEVTLRTRINDIKKISNK
ncbi:MAG: hypothetical protein KGD63_08050 [Candidatus Lokiarchaeota archaeon]|nr:hypothetical protein [Candidatus Lokiarchaeota archaeon]